MFDIRESKAVLMAVLIFITSKANSSEKNNILYEAPRLVMEIKPEASDSNGLNKFKVNLFKGLLCKKSGLNYETNYASLCDRQPIETGKVTFRCSASWQNQSTWEIDLAKKDDLIDANFIGFIYSNCYSDISNQKKLAIKAIYEGSAITEKELEISKNWSDWGAKDIFLFDPNDMVFYTHNEINFPQDEKNKLAYIAAFNKFKEPEEQQYTEKLEKKRQADGYPLIDLFKNCYTEQIESLKTGNPISRKWFPNKKKYSAEEHYFKIISAVDGNPFRLVIEGPGDMVDSTQNKCLIVISLPKKLVLKSSGLKSGNSIGEFKLKRKGTLKLKFKAFAALVPTDLLMPEFELLSDFTVLE